ncbi:MAG TPA: hypothetical protein VL284_05815 [Thermoanaerobaculia bacterium]|nr:hypothetical protein [Thermoanaerobaculia bacterium]
MPRLLAALCIVVFAAAALADDKDDAAKLKAFRELNPDNRIVQKHGVEFHAGYVELHYFGADWRFFYLPLLAPLPGSRLEDEATIPNAFQQLGMPYASSMPPMFQNDRPPAEEREFQRIEKMTKDQKVVATPDSQSPQ